MPGCLNNGFSKLDTPHFQDGFKVRRFNSTCLCMRSLQTKHFEYGRNNSHVASSKQIVSCTSMHEHTVAASPPRTLLIKLQDQHAFTFRTRGSNLTPSQNQKGTITRSGTLLPIKTLDSAKWHKWLPLVQRPSMHRTRSGVAKRQVAVVNASSEVGMKIKNLFLTTTTFIFKKSMKRRFQRYSYQWDWRIQQAVQSSKCNMFDKFLRPFSGILRSLIFRKGLYSLHDQTETRCEW